MFSYFNSWRELCLYILFIDWICLSVLVKLMKSKFGCLSVVRVTIISLWTYCHDFFQVLVVNCRCHAINSVMYVHCMYVPCRFILHQRDTINTEMWCICLYCLLIVSAWLCKQSSWIWNWCVHPSPILQLSNSEPIAWNSFKFSVLGCPAQATNLAMFVFFL